MAVGDGFRRVKLPPGPGISYGTVQYYLGISYREMGNESRAREALQGIPAETRQAFPDLTNGFERILPGEFLSEFGLYSFKVFDHHKKNNN